MLSFLATLCGMLFVAGGILALLVFAPQHLNFLSNAQSEAPPAAPLETTSATITFVGDIMLDRTMRRVLTEKGPAHIFDGVAELLGGSDLTVGNLEGPVTSNKSVSLGSKPGDPSNMRFTFSPEVPAMLAVYGFDLVAIGNNHILDFGTEGAKSTKQALAASGISYVGDPIAPTIEPLYRQVEGMRIAFIGYNDFHGRDGEGVTRAITRAKEEGADAIIVLPHWGTEYEAAPPKHVRELAHAWAAAGATLIMGTHSHIIGEKEVVGTTTIYYSLGNFVFDQYFEPRTMCGLAVTATLTKSESGVSVAVEETEVGTERDGRTVIGCSRS